MTTQDETDRIVGLIKAYGTAEYNAGYEADRGDNAAEKRIAVKRLREIKEAIAALCPVLPATDPAEAYARRITIPYRNHRGEFAMREIGPIRLLHGSNEWHPEPQWLIEAWDIAKSSIRTFALSGIGVLPATGPDVVRGLVEALEAARDHIGLIYGSGDEMCVTADAALAAHRAQTTDPSAPQGCVVPDELRELGAKFAEHGSSLGNIHGQRLAHAAINWVRSLCAAPNPPVRQQIGQGVPEVDDGARDA